MSPHVPLHAERDRRGLRPPVLTGVVAVALLAATLVASPLTLADAAEIRAMTLPIHPDRVDDVYWSDTYGAPRSGGRGHIGVDMMGEKMIPLLAVRSGTVTWGRFNNARGSILRIRDADGWEYQYIHLNNDSPGTDDGSASCTETFSARLCAAIVNGRFASGTRVTEGEMIGYLGDGGNAEHTRPHLHFEVYKPSGSGPVPINPTASVDAARRRLAESPGTTAGPPPRVAPGDAGFVDHVWFQLHGRRPTAGERAVFESEIAADGVWSALAGHLDSTTTAATVDRLYLAFFHRYPDVDGLQYWIQALGSGREPEEVAEWFADSDEFRARYHGVDFGVFLDRLYLDVLGRQPDQDGKAFWLRELESGAITRGTIVVQFTESLELKDLSARRNELVALSLVKDGAVPSATDLSAWSQLRASASVAAAAASWYGS